MKRRILITVLVVLLAVTGITSFAYGERTEPYYAYTARTFTYEFFTKPKKVSLILLDMKYGAEANRIVENDNPYNSDPAKDEQWLFFKFRLKYVSGPEEELYAYEIINPYYSFTKKDGASLNIEDAVLFWENYLGVFDVSLWPGNEAVFCVGILLKKSDGFPLVKVEHTYNAYIWFNTDPKYPKVTSASYNSIKLAWRKIPNAKKYDAYYSTSKSGAYKKLVTTTGTSYTKSGLVTGKKYYFKVRYYNASGSASSFSLPASGKPVPATPKSVKAASASYTSNRISWKAVSGATRYEIYRAASSKGKYARIGTTTATSYKNTGLKTGKIYYYKARAYHLEGGKKIYGGFSSVVSAKPVPATPASVKAVRASSTSIRITWKKVSGATRYEVYNCTTKNGTFKKAATVLSNGFTKKGLKTGRTYYFKVRAYHLEDGKKVYGKFSSAVHATT